MTNFFKIGEVRIHKSTVKKYCPNGEKKLNIYYNTSRYKIEVETFEFSNRESRDAFIESMDLIF